MQYYLHHFSQDDSREASQSDSLFSILQAFWRQMEIFAPIAERIYLRGALPIRCFRVPSTIPSPSGGSHSSLCRESRINQRASVAILSPYIAITSWRLTSRYLLLFFVSSTSLCILLPLQRQRQRRRTKGIIIHFLVR